MRGDVTEAVELVQAGNPAFFKFIAANETGETGGHQCGYYIPKDFLSFAFDGPCRKGSNRDLSVDVNWNNGQRTRSRFVYYGKAILVLDGTKRISKELLYTAITRQRRRLVVLFNDQAYKLRDYSLASCSDLAQRFTCLFENPLVTEFQKRYYEEGLIHVTAGGELVRSKSEVIIANMLRDAGVPYEYEKQLDVGDGHFLLPDFTIEDAETGKTFYWEHCGMLTDESYRCRWKMKKGVYERLGLRDNLIVSEDEENGSINCKRIAELIRQIVG